MSVEATGNKSQNPLSLITEQHVTSALRKDKGDEAQLLNWNISNFTENGDNLATVVTRVVVDYSLVGSQTHQTSYIIKINPCLPAGLHDLFTSMLFEKEVNFYEEVLPDLNHMLQKAGQESLRMPQLIHSSLEEGSELLILEDLRLRGFVMVEKFEGQDEAHIRLALKELSRLHASSVLLQAKLPDMNLTVRYPVLGKDWIYCTGEDKKRLNKMICGNYQNSVGILKCCKRHTASAWVERNASNTLDLFQEQLARNPPFELICHGDFWNNNMLFRYNKAGDPVEVMLVDNQVTRVASPATDLSNFLYTSVKGHIRRRNLHEFLGDYYTTFSHVVQAGGVTVPYTLSELKHEFRSKMLYGVLIFFLVAPLYLGKGVDGPTAGDFMSENSKEKMEAWRQGVADESLQNSPSLEQFFLMSVDDIVEAGVIS